MNLKAILTASLVTLGLGMSQAFASTMTATSLFPGGSSDFSIDFIDSNSNTLLDFSEITSFSGPTFFFITGVPIANSVLLMPSIADITIGNGEFWNFACNTSCDVLHSTNNWSYNLQLDPSPVPIPAALPLLAAGLSAMSLMGWRRKRKAIL